VLLRRHHIILFIRVLLPEGSGLVYYFVSGTEQVLLGVHKSTLTPLKIAVCIVVLLS